MQLDSKVRYVKSLGRETAVWRLFAWLDFFEISRVELFEPFSDNGRGDCLTLMLVGECDQRRASLWLTKRSTS
jgi:hypothetical protein